MKKILITGRKSYVGNSLAKWLKKNSDKYLIDFISLRDESWKEKDFSMYDVIFHVAGLAHIKETKENAYFYYKINRDLAYEVAQKAKMENVKQFIFFSSMSVYGIGNGVIRKDTPIKPKSNYGKSKLQAEELISTLDDGLFKVVILRPPMIYGKGCKGNYTRLVELALKTPIFPDVDNKRSMIFIDNLCEFVKCVIDNHDRGIFFPQNSEYVKTSEMVELIARAHNKKLKLNSTLNPAVNYFCRKINLVSKVFGTLVYDKSLSVYKDDYNVFSFNESINITEQKLQ